MYIYIYIYDVKMIHHKGEIFKTCFHKLLYIPRIQVTVQLVYIII